MGRPLPRLLVALLVLASLGSFGRAIVIAASTTTQTAAQEAHNAKLDVVTEELARRVGMAEHDLADLKPDVAVLKSDMAEVKWIARGAATGIVSLILMTVFGMPVKRAAAARESAEV